MEKCNEGADGGGDTKQDIQSGGSKAGTQAIAEADRRNGRQAVYIKSDTQAAGQSSQAVHGHTWTGTYIPVRTREADVQSQLLWQDTDTQSIPESIPEGVHKGTNQATEEIRARTRGRIMREEGGDRFPRGSIRSILHSRYVPFFAHILSPSRVHFPPFVLNPRTAEAQRGAMSPFQRQLSSFCRHLDGKNVTHGPKCKDSMITALAWVIWACPGNIWCRVVPGLDVLSPHALSSGCSLAAARL